MTTGNLPGSLHGVLTTDFWKIIKIVAPVVSIFNAKMHQIRFRLALRPRPRWGSSPDQLDLRQIPRNAALGILILSPVPARLFTYRTSVSGRKRR